MLYFGIDQHRKQLTVNIRDERGDVVLKRQVRTQWDRVRRFFHELRERAEPECGFLAIVEIWWYALWRASWVHVASWPSWKSADSMTGCWRCSGTTDVARRY